MNLVVGVPQASLYSMNVIKTYWPLILLVLFFSLFYLVYVNFFTADLGRHIVNGQEIVAGGIAGIFNSGAIFKTNYYSFTQTDFPFTNHHWLFGVIVFYLHEIGGFNFLTWFNTVFNILAFIFILATATKITEKTGEKRQFAVWVTTIVGFLLLPLLTHRTEIRPESVSLLLFSLYYYLFRSLLIRKKKWVVFFVLLLQILWTNTHLFFILGPLLAGYFMFERMLVLFFENQKKITESFRIIISDSLVRFWFGLLASLFAVGLFNPNGIKGLLAPLTIFNNYAYRVAENQSTFFMINYGSQVIFYGFAIVCSFFAFMLGIYSLLQKKNSNENYGKRIAQFILVVIFATFTNKINRLTPFFSVIALPFLVSNLVPILQNIWNKNKKKLQNTVITMICSTLFFILILIIIKLKIFLPQIEKIGTGLPPGIQNAAHFFIQNDLHGPVFNNYDIGGYLAYNLFPQEKLFIDNRPEAYSADFLTQEFLLSFTDETVWQKVSDKYNLNVIFFYRHDQIDGAQQFLFNRVTDSNWVPVYVDGYALILVKNSESNKKIIEKFKLPENIFVMNSN